MIETHVFEFFFDFLTQFLRKSDYENEVSQLGTVESARFLEWNGNRKFH